MASKFITLERLSQLFEGIKQRLNAKVDKVTGKGLSTNDYTDSAKEKVDAIPSNPKFTDTTYNLATSTADGLMPKDHFAKVDAIPENPKYTDTIYTHPSNHSADMITESATKKFITTSEKTKLGELNYTRAMTQAQYDALSDAEKNRTDVWYGIYEE